MSEVSVKFGAQDENLTSTLNKVQKELKQVETQGVSTNDKVSMSFSSMAAAGASLALGVGAIKAAFGAVGSAVDLFTSAISKAGDMQTMRTAFIPILGSADAAQKRIEELSKFAAETPFEMPGIMQASKTLQIFTKGALATGDGLRMVGDVAAGVDAPIEELATWFGRLYDGLKTGKQPIGEAAARLQELGAMSGETRGKIESLASSGANFSDVWGEVQAAMGIFTGSMALQSKTWNGVMRKMNDNWNLLLVKFGEPIIERITPILDAIAESAGALQAKAADLGKSFVNAFTGPGGAMAGFQIAVDSFKLGNLSSAWNIMWTSVKLQASESINSIYSNVIASGTAASKFLVEMLGPGSGVFTAIGAAFDYLSGKLAIGIGGAIHKMIKDMPFIGDSVKESLVSSIAITDGVGGQWFAGQGDVGPGASNGK